jgi:hypothetical protein
MNFLFWAFLAGTAAVSFPLIFHLIRRTPRGRQEFSSLMFLKASPPRLTRRSRLDNLLLLLLRALAILLLAAAFMRPYWRAIADVTISDIPGRHVAILLDNSASMRRGNLWSQAVAEVEGVLAGLEAADEVALYTYSDRLTPVVAFDEDRDVERAPLRDILRTRLEELRPTWAATNLGGALVSAADALDAVDDAKKSGSGLQVVVVSDLQQGANLSALQAYQWPEHVQVAVHQVTPADESNARVTLLEPADGEGEGEGESDAEDRQPRVRVKNAASSMVDQFTVRWATGTSRDALGEEVAFYVPAGQSRVLKMPRSDKMLTADRLILSGDAADFDNTYYTAPLRQEIFRLAYLGDDNADDEGGLRYYLESALAETPRRKVQFQWLKPGGELSLLESELPHLIVVAGAISDAQRQSLEKYRDEGGTILAVLRSEEMARSLGDLTGEFEVVGEVEAARGGSRYAMLAEIDFTHPLFATFAGARYNDFTRIHFWRHRRVELSEDSPAQILARFDDGAPALWELAANRGTVLVLAGGWHPDDSELALSTKFVPLLGTLVERSGEPTLNTTSAVVGQSIAIPQPEASNSETAPERVIHRPDGGEFKLASSAATFEAADEPGLYTLASEGRRQPFAVNVASQESDTDPLEASALEQLGVKLGSQPSQAAQAERLRQLRDTELESRQQIWKWLVVAALCILGVETCLAGWRAFNQSRQEETGSQEASVA